MYYNKQELAEAIKNGESYAIPYPYAIKRKPETGTHIVTMVTWDDAPVKRVDVQFETIGWVSVVAPVEGLPNGYKMVTHKDNATIWAAIYDEPLLKKASFEYLDKVCRDFELIRKVTGAEYGDLFLHELRPDYIEWSRKFSEAWDERITQFNRVYEEALFKLYPDDDTVGPRTMPPDLKTLIKQISEQMIKAVDWM